MHSAVFYTNLNMKIPPSYAQVKAIFNKRLLMLNKIDDINFYGAILIYFIINNLYFFKNFSDIIAKEKKLFIITIMNQHIIYRLPNSGFIPQLDKTIRYSFNSNGDEVIYRKN